MQLDAVRRPFPIHQIEGSLAGTCCCCGVNSAIWQKIRYLYRYVVEFHQLDNGTDMQSYMSLAEVPLSRLLRQRLALA